MRRLAAWWRRTRVRPVPPIHHIRDVNGRVLAWSQPLTRAELAELAAPPGRRDGPPAGWLAPRDSPRTHTRRTLP
jgi:hypothetical protein